MYRFKISFLKFIAYSQLQNHQQGIIMVRSKIKFILLLICFFVCLYNTHSKSLLLHSLQYDLSSQKSLSMYNVQLHDQNSPVFILITPDINNINNQTTIKIQQNPFALNADIQKETIKIEDNKKRQKVAYLHHKLQIPIRIRIQNGKQKQTQCLIDEPWDLCLIQKPATKTLQFSIHCQINPSQSSQNNICKGQAKVKQANKTVITQYKQQTKEKIKYDSGLFVLPKLNNHGLMLITCQDDNLPEFTQSLRIFSSVPYHRYQRQNSQQTKQIVGFDKASPPANSIKKQNYVYLEVQQISIRKCLQFQFHSEKSLINNKQVMDFVNFTDTSYKNSFQILKATQNSKTVDTNYFQHSMEINLKVFKLLKFVAGQSYDIKLSILNKANKQEVISYLFPLAIHNQTSLQSNNIYSRNNHYHFTYIVGKQIIKNVSSLQIDVKFIVINSSQSSQPAQIKHTQTQRDNYIFFSLSVQDNQHITIQKLHTSHISMKKGEHLTFIIQEPYQVTQIMTSKGQANDLVTIVSNVQLKATLSQYSTNHQHNNQQCHFSKGCKFQIDALEDCLNCKIQYRTQFIKSSNDMLLLQIKNERLLGKIDLDQTQYFYKKIKYKQVVEVMISTPNLIVYTLQTPQDIKRCQIPKKSCHSQIGTSHQILILDDLSSNNKRKNNKNSKKPNNNNQPNTNNQTALQRTIYFAIQGLDSTRFIINFIGSQRSIAIQNGQSFTYKLPDNKNYMQLIFDVPDYQYSKQYTKNITFNLIAALNALQMSITQLDQKGEEHRGFVNKKSMSGYIKLNAKFVKSKRIKIILKKTLLHQEHGVHFSLIVSTSDHKYRLDNGITHYQTFDSLQQKTFIIQFIDSQVYQLNMHFYDTQSQQVNFKVAIFNPTQWQNQKNNLNYTINTKQYTIYLDENTIDRKDMCPQNDPECTLFIMVSSMMNHEVDVSFTLLSQQNVIQLKDGIWESYNIDNLLMKSHFYFIPNHQTKPAKIFFKSTNQQVYLSARLYDNRLNVNPSQWPFPETHQHHQNQQPTSISRPNQFQSNKLIQIDNTDPEFIKCFPHCVILLSVGTNDQSLKPINNYMKPTIGPVDSQKDNKQKIPTLSILGSNNQIQLPQKMKMTLELKEDQEQFVFVGLGHAIKDKRQLVTFFTNYLVGYASVYAKVYIPSLQNVPDVNDYDFLFDPIKTQIKLQDINRYIMQNLIQMSGINSLQQMEQKNQVYLALLIQAHQTTKMTIQYTTDYQQIKQLQLDSAETIQLKSGQQKIYQFIPIKDQKIKFIRNVGYPLFYQFKCQKTDYDNCLKTWLAKLKYKSQDDIRNLKRQRQMQNQMSQIPIRQEQQMQEIAALSQQQHFSQYQVLKKTQTRHVIQCQQCIMFVWIYALQVSQLTIQLQSLNTQTNLKQNDMINDYLEPNQFHRFILSRVQKQDTTLIVTMNQGDAIVTVSDNLDYKQTKRGSQVPFQGMKSILFNIPPMKKQPRKGEFQQLKLQSQQHSFNKIFSNIHVTITPEGSRPVSYSITYSSGQHQMYLKNGIITNHFIFQNQQTVFYYKNQNKAIKSYLTISVQAAEDQLVNILKGIYIKMYALILDKKTNELTRNQLLSQKPSNQRSLKKQTTLTYQIPPFQNIQIDIGSSITTMVTIGISDRKFVYLPLNYEYPLFLKPNQQIKFVIQNMFSQFVQIVVKKCDTSNPIIYYTNDEEQFQKDDYSNYDRLGTENIYKHVVKAKGEKKTVYLKVKADPKDQSILMVGTKYHDQNDNKNFVDLDPGNMGIIDYQFLNLEDIRLNFKGIQCGKLCRPNVIYYLVRSKSLPVIYKQMVCAGQQMIKLFESGKNTHIDINKPKQQSKQQSQQHPSPSTNTNSSNNSTSQIKSLLQPISQFIKVQKISQKPNQQTNQVQVKIPASYQYTYLTIKAVYQPTGEEIYYRPIQIKTLQSNIKNFSWNYIYATLGIILTVILIIICVTKNLSRKGYIHVGQDDTMIA